MNRLSNIPIYWPGATIIVGLIITIITVVLLFGLHTQSKLAAIFNPNDPTVIALQHALEDFPVADQLLVMVSDKKNNNGNEKLKRFAKKLKTQLNSKKNSNLIKSVHYRTSPQFVNFFQSQVIPSAIYYLDKKGRKKLRYLLSEKGMTKQLKSMRSMLELPGAAGGALSRAQSNDPLNLHKVWQSRLSSFFAFTNNSNLDYSNLDKKNNGQYLFSKDNKNLLIRIEGSKPPGDIQFSKSLIRVVNKSISSTNKDNLKVHIAGAYAVASYDATKIKSDVIWELFTTIIAIIILLIILYRRPIRLSLFAFVPVAVGVVWGFGIYSLFYSSITPLAAVIGGALCGIGIDYPVHYLVHYQTNRENINAKEAARKTLVHLGKPTFIAWFTSVLGFAVVGISPLGILHDFAIIGSLGLLGVGLTTFFLLPSTLILLDKKQLALPTLPRVDIGKKIATLVTRQPSFILTTSLIVLLFAIAYISWSGIPVGLSSNLLELHPKPNPPLEAQRKISQTMNLPNSSLFLHLQTKSPDKLIELAYKVDNRLNSKQAHAGGIEGSFGLASLLPNPKSHSLGLDFKVIKNNFHLALSKAGYQPGTFSRYLNFIKKLITPNQAVNINDLLRYPQIAKLVLSKNALQGKPATQSLIMIKLDSPLDNRASRKITLDALHNSLKGLDGVSLTGPAVLSNHVQSSLAKFLPYQIALALILILLCLFWYSRSFLYGLLALIPALFAALFVFAYMDITATKWNIINGVMAPVLLGITVDYGIFVLAMKKNNDVKNITPISSAALTCALTTIVGWGSLITTSIPAVRSLGILIAIGIAAALFATLFIFIPLLGIIFNINFFNRE